MHSDGVQFFHVYYFHDFGPLKSKYLEKKLYGHNPLGMLNHIGFQNFKKVEFWLKQAQLSSVKAQRRSEQFLCWALDFPLLGFKLISFRL